MKGFIVAVLAGCCAGLIGGAWADDNTLLIGTWKWWNSPARGQLWEITLKLNMAGDQLKGTVVGQEGQETEIEDVEFKNGNFSFRVTGERDGQKVTISYEGKVIGDTIRGTTRSDRDIVEWPWKAKRVERKTRHNDPEQYRQVTGDLP